MRKQEKKSQTKIESSTVSSLHEGESIQASLFAADGSDLILFRVVFFSLEPEVLATFLSQSGSKGRVWING